MMEPTETTGVADSAGGTVETEDWLEGEGELERERVLQSQIRRADTGFVEGELLSPVVLECTVVDVVESDDDSVRSGFSLFEYDGYEFLMFTPDTTMIEGLEGESVYAAAYVLRYGVVDQSVIEGLYLSREAAEETVDQLHEYSVVGEYPFRFNLVQVSDREIPVGVMQNQVAGVPEPVLGLREWLFRADERHGWVKRYSGWVGLAVFMAVGGVVIASPFFVVNLAAFVLGVLTVSGVISREWGFKGHTAVPISPGRLVAVSESEGTVSEFRSVEVEVVQGSSGVRVMCVELGCEWRFERGLFGQLSAEGAEFIDSAIGPGSKTAVTVARVTTSGEEESGVVSDDGEWRLCL